MRALLFLLIGGFVGALCQALLPRLLYGPRLKAVSMEHHRSYHSYNLTIVNGGRVAAINATGRITIRPITEDSIANTWKDVKRPSEAIRNATGARDWRESDDAWLIKEDWSVGIEAEHLHWATYPNPTALNLSPHVPERLSIAHSRGQWVDIASESFSKKRVRLVLGQSHKYYGEVIVVAENCGASKPFRFSLTLGVDGCAKFESYEGRLPDRQPR